MSSHDLLERFQTASVDQSELELLFQVHFSRSKGVSPKEVHYLRDNSSDVTLIVRYNNNGELSGIDAGPALRCDNVAQLEEKIDRLLVKTIGVGFGQTVLFAYVPTTGYFRYVDRFQIVPLPDRAPRPPFLAGDHPLLLQFAVQESEDFQITNMRRDRIAREIELLCGALTTNIWKGESAVLKHHWVLTEADDPATWTSEFLQEGYTYPGANRRTEVFADVTGMTPMLLTSHDEYYSRMGITVKQVLDLPADFADLLDRFYALSRDDRDQFLRSSFWFHHARNVASVSRSASFTALVSAIEALLPPPGVAAKCEACERPMGQGPTARFVEFVHRFAPEPTVSKASRRKLYALRSALSHGGSLLLSDRKGWMGALTGKSVDEWEDQQAMWRIVRVALVNWLQSRRGGEDT